MPRKYALNNKCATDVRETKEMEDEDHTHDSFLQQISNHKEMTDQSGRDLMTLMQRSAKLLQNEITDLSPIGFAKLLANELKNTDNNLPRGIMTERDGIDMMNKRDYFNMNYQLSKNGIIITPPNEKLNWTVVFLRDLPKMHEIDMCQNRVVIVTSISSIDDIIYFIKKDKLQQYLQTISIDGSDKFVENVAEEFSLIGACPFPKVGEHNKFTIGAPWDGEFILRDLVRWNSIEF